MHWPRLTVLRRCFTVWCALMVTAAGAQSGADGVLPLPQYPRGSIRAVAQADQALVDASAAQLLQEQTFGARRRECYGLLVAEPCLRAAIDDNARAVRHIRAVQVEAREFKRRQSEREVRAGRDAQRARESIDAPKKQAEREQTRASQEQRVARKAAAERTFEAGASERAQRAQSEKRRAQEKRAARLRKQADERAQTAERIERARAHEAKVQETLTRARQREARERESAGRKVPSGVPSAGSAPPPTRAAPGT